MITVSQQQLLTAINECDVANVRQLLISVNPNFLDEEGVPPLSHLTDRLFDWWQTIVDAYEANQTLSEAHKTQALAPYLDILQALIDADVNVHLWDSEEVYGPLWDAASAACVPVVSRLLQAGVNPNTRDDEGLTILSSISELMFDCDFDQIDWSQALPEEQAVLTLLREQGAKMTKELAS